jgi:protein-disulfide isomerase
MRQRREPRVTLRPCVAAIFMGGVRIGVNGTPTFFLDGLRYDGLLDEQSLEAVLRSELRA